MTENEILWLGRPGSADSALAGAKAARLAELVDAGFPVPEGFVVTTQAFERYAAGDGALADSLVAALATAVAELGEQPLAVRSSSSAEDLHDASFAGMYETVLGVRGAEALAEAVRRCWASASAERVRSYHGGAQPEDPAASRARRLPPMAVLVQRLVQADAAGVAFTANPVTGDRGEVLVSAVGGLGDRLVSGEASPDEWTVRDGRATCRRRVEGAITADQARAVAALARSVERHLGFPQDVEWALAGDEIHLLQARPITTLPDEPIAVAVDVPDGFWEREASHYPEPLSPFMRAIELPTQNAAFRRAFAEFGVLLEGLEFREIGGWVYQRAVPLGGKDGNAPPWWLLALLGRIVPELRRRIAVCRDAVAEDRAGRNLERWFGEWRPEFVKRIREARAVDLRALSDQALAGELEARIQLVRDGLETHVTLAMSMLQLGELVLTARELLGWQPAKTMALFAGRSETSTEPAKRLAELARAAAERPAVVAALEREGAPADVRAADPAFAEAIDAYEDEFGCRALRYDVAESTLAEEPSILLALLRDQLARTFDAAGTEAALRSMRDEALGEARAALANRSEEERDRFERDLRRAERYYPTREDNEFFTISAPLALLRYAAVELGRRLTERRAIATGEDVFFLEPNEALAALREGGDRRDAVRRRKGERRWVKANPGPPSYGTDPGPPPDFRGLPREARRTMESLLTVIELVFESAGSQDRQAHARKLTGVAASPGRYRGTVRVLTGEHEFAKLRPGDVLVCPITSPVWSILFANVGALITDTGGILSHPAIIAREYRVPAVVATGNATELLADGQVVTVDGAAGTVEVDGS